MHKMLLRCGRGVVLLGILSVIVAALQFVVPLYMLAIYNRILQTGSVETLQLITIISAVLLLIMGVAEVGRSRVVSIMSRHLGRYLNKDVYQAVLASPSSVLGEALKEADKKSDEPALRPQDARTRALSDLRQVTTFVSSGALNTLFDAVLAPLFLGALFVLHPILGWIGVGAAAVILSLAFLAEVLARRANKQIGEAEGRAQSKIERSIWQFDALSSMGIIPNLYRRWREDREEAMRLSFASQSVIGIIGGAARAIRLIVQIGVLGVGAWLALNTDVFLIGAIIAASVIMARALAPIDQSIAIWQRFVQSRSSANRLMSIMDVIDAQPKRGNAPPPQAKLTLKSVTIGFPNQRIPMLRGANLEIDGGNAIGILGPVGAGKTTLLRAMLGIIRPQSGTILLGATPVDNFTEPDRQKLFGYLPQDIQLLPGSIAENISRFSLSEDAGKAMFMAADEMNALGFIEALQEGFATAYETDTLSAGQTQLVGLARAIFGDPLLIGLDEPTANLDEDGKRCVCNMLEGRKRRGKITIFVSHDHDVLRTANTLLYLAPGVARYGNADDVLGFVVQQQQQAAQAIEAKVTGAEEKKPK